MLAQLSIRDIVLIDRLDLQLGSGLVVLTGETGAGKSVLVRAVAGLWPRGEGRIVTPRGRILGATIVGANAGELILPWALALSQKLGIGAMAGVVAPYPTLSELGKRAAGSFYLPKLTGEATKRVVRLLARLAP